jgi:hypothetical protein
VCSSGCVLVLVPRRRRSEARYGTAKMLCTFTPDGSRRINSGKLLFRTFGVELLDLPDCMVQVALTLACGVFHSPGMYVV